jgi:hypothetical protein
VVPALYRQTFQKPRRAAIGLQVSPSTWLHARSYNAGATHPHHEAIRARHCPPVHQKQAWG